MKPSRKKTLALFLLKIETMFPAASAWSHGLPQYVMKKGRAPKSSQHMLSKTSQQTKRSTQAQNTELQRTLQRARHSVTTSHSFASASAGGQEPLPLPDEERETLSALYQSLNGPEWHTKDGWMSASNPCGNGTLGDAWYGLQCATFESDKSSHVTGVVLPQNNLVGNLPPLHSLQHLVHLDFSTPGPSEVSSGIENSLVGTLDALCGLGNLSSIFLTGNNLAGSIPDCVQSLANATVLDLDFNAIQGTTPNELCRLHNLEELHLRGNRLQGTVPECFGEELTALRILDYSNINTDFIMGIQSLSGTLPDSLCDLKNLEFIMFQATLGLNGPIPHCLGTQQPHFIGLALQKNQFQGSISTDICQVSTLEYLALTENALTGALPSCLGRLSLLSDLDLAVNQFHGPIPEELCQPNALENLYLYNNSLTGTIPSCLGSLTQLNVLELSFNLFRGSVPEALCQASALESLHLRDNALTGSLPNCLAMSFPFLGSMLLHNNDFTGAVPLEWALPSLISIMLSNNPKLSGSLPPSLFLQQSVPEVSRYSNIILRAVVIEGTSIGGTLPEALCGAPHLVTLAFSGNELTGSLPNCVTSLQSLQTLRVSNNHLTGMLPAAINNMTSLNVLDLSTNKIQGRVPAGLGDISSNLDIMHLHLNRLSCDLPPSVLDWQLSSTDASFNLLDGNLFSCDTNSKGRVPVLSMRGATGLRNANEQAFDSYSCGNSVYVLPIITIATLAIPIVLGLIYLLCRGRLALQWRAAIEWTVNPSFSTNELDNADRQIKVLALGVMVAATLAGSVALVLSFYVAKSAFECEYMATLSLANKGAGDVGELSIGVGAVVCVGLIFGLSPWWRRLVAKCSRYTNDYGSNAVEKNKPLYSLEENAEAWAYDAERMAEATPQKPAAFSSFVTCVQLLKMTVFFCAVIVLTVGPNFGYVIIVLSELTQQQKVASEVAIILAKTAIGTLLVPKVARKAVDKLVLNGALTFVRFRLRMAVATALSALTMIVIPISIVLVTDKRCLYYTIRPQPAVDSPVPISYCVYYESSTGLCSEYATVSFTSTYLPRFSYHGEECVSAVLSVYGPVFLGAVFLSAALPAGIETFVVPWLAPWCYRNVETSEMARTGLAFLRAVTWNVWPALADAGALPRDFSLGTVKLDFLAQRIVERAFVQVMVTLIVALTFGIAVPVVGFACAVAAYVHILHHRHVLGQIINLGRIEQPAAVPNLKGCTDIPVACSVVVVFTVVLVWMCGAVSYFEPAVIGCILLIGLGLALAACGVVAWWRRFRSKAPQQHQDRAQSTASSDTSRGMLMESLLAEDEFTEGSESN